MLGNRVKGQGDGHFNSPDVCARWHDPRSLVTPHPKTDSTGRGYCSADRSVYPCWRSDLRRLLLALDEEAANA